MGISCSAGLGSDFEYPSHHPLCLPQQTPSLPWHFQFKDLPTCLFIFSSFVHQLHIYQGPRLGTGVTEMMEHGPLSSVDHGFTMRERWLLIQTITC